MELFDLVTNDPTEAGWPLVDRIDLALEKNPGETPSFYARKVGCGTTEAKQVLQWLVARRMAHTSGNGAWTHYHHGREV